MSNYASTTQTRVPSIAENLARFEAIKIDIEMDRPISTQDAHFLLEKIEILSAQRNILCGRVRAEEMGF